MKSSIKTLAILMMLITVNMVSAQSFSNRAIVVNSNNETVQPAYQQFDVTVQNNNGVASITWNLPIENMEGFYITERSDDGVNYLPIAVKRFSNVPANSNNILAMQYALEDKTPIEGTVYYKFTKSNQQGDILQANVIPVVAPTSTIGSAVTSTFDPKP
jgi:hypothetical protein